MLSTYERVERCVFLLAVLVLILDLNDWFGWVQ
jgi:hypothetical protein